MILAVLRSYERVGGVDFFDVRLLYVVCCCGARGGVGNGYFGLWFVGEQQCVVVG